ncbi:MAG: SDR family NAD(P)-dependent oxidoreductase [Polyangiaceae bacterium]
MEAFRAKYGPWAVVTGASSGIGEALAREIASRGVSVVLAARRASRLEALAETLRHTSHVDALVVEIDLVREGAAADLVAALGDRDVGLVCANAGFGEKGAFLDHGVDVYRRMIRLNCESTVELAHAMTARLVARGRGGILVVSSTAAFQGTPWTSTYAATKAFDLVFAEGLHHELAGHGVDVVALCPGSTDTEGPKRTGVDPKRVPFGMASAASVARAGLDGLGRTCVVVPRLVDRVASLSTRLVPRRLASKLAGNAIRKVIGP